MKDIQVKNEYEVVINDHVFSLDKSEAEDLYYKLKTALGKNELLEWPSIPDYPPSFPTYPSHPVPIVYTKTEGDLK